MFRNSAICGLLVAGLFLIAGQGALADDFPEGAEAVHLKIVPDQKLGETLTARAGDVIYSDSRSPVHRRVVADGDIRDVCAGGVCHNVPAGTEYVQIPYGMSMYCTRELYAKRESLFSDREEHACLRMKQTAGGYEAEVFSIGSFRDKMRINPQKVDMGNYLRVEDVEMEQLPPNMSGGWGHFFQPVELVYLGVSDGRFRLKLVSKEDREVSRLISYPYSGGEAAFPVSGVNPKIEDTDYEKVSFRLTDVEVTGMTIQVQSADEDHVTYSLKQVTFERQFMGSKINLAQENTTISMTYGPAK